MLYRLILKLLPNTILIFCFGLSSTNAALADQIINVSPIIVQPEDLVDINQQMLAQDRINRDQELAIRGLINDNHKLTDTALARQQDATLEKINQTLKNYNDALLARDRARIAANGQGVSPRYWDLVNLTENVDGMKDVGKTLKQKNDVIQEKYKTLTELKDEMVTLNEKLKGQAANENFSKTPPQQEDKIQFLTRRLGEMDQKIAKFDDILAEKDRQISRLKDSLAKAQSEAASREDKIHWLNQVVTAEKNKAEYYRLTSLQKAAPRQDDRVRLAKQLISLQQQEMSILEEKNRLWGAHYALVDQHVLELENKIKGLMAAHQFQGVDLQSRMEVLKHELNQKTQQVELLKSELENKITEDNGQGAVTNQVQDLRAQLQDKDEQLAALRAKIRSGEETGGQTYIFKQQLAEQQSKVDLLKQELENKIGESDKMTLMMSDYQRKLEAKDNAYNDLLGQIVKIRKDMQELQQLSSVKDREEQSRELNSSMVQQKATAQEVKDYQDKIKSLETELALERQQLEGMPNSDEISYLRTGMKTAAAELKQKDETISLLKTNAGKFENDFKLQSLDYQNLKAQLQSLYAELHRDSMDIKEKDLEITRLKERYTVAQGKVYINSEETALKSQLKQKDEMLSLAKANALEYERKYKEQSKEFQSLKAQLQDAYDEISRKNEDLKYKEMEVIRLKERSPLNKTIESKGGDLQEQLRIADLQIKDLQGKLNKFSAYSKDDVIRQKLKQALEEIDEQGKVINILAQKLQDAGQSVNLTQYLGKRS
jgi:chromosome segregation ATPase